MAGTDKVNLVIGEEGMANAPPPVYEQVPQGVPMTQQPPYSAPQQTQYAPPPTHNPYPAPQPVIAQPSVTNTTNTVVQLMAQPASDIPKPPYPQRVNAWTTGLCDCCSDMSVCLIGFFCHPCMACKVAIHMDENCCTPCCGGIAAMRTKLRTQLGIRGSVNSDCCASLCCGPCVVCQMEREMNNWGL